MAGKAMQIVIALDGAGGSEAALSDLKRAGLPEQVDALVLSVADVILPSDDAVIDRQRPELGVEEMQEAKVRGLEAVEQARAIAVSGQRSAQASFPQWTVHAEAVADSPAWAIVRRAEELKADLIIVGSHGRSTLGRLMLGSVSQSVLHYAATSVRISRGPGRPESAPIRLVAGEDGSADAEAAVAALAARVWADGTTVQLVTAVDQVMAMTALASSAAAKARDWIQRVNERSAAMLRAAGLSVSTLVADGDPRRILVDEAERLKADAIFIGARGLRGIERIVLGSVSTAVATRARCSVEVVRSRQTAIDGESRR
jgi:nucleotide-binding universal stress UspA family protein